MKGLAALIVKDYMGNAKLCEQLSVDQVTIDDSIAHLKLKNGEVKEKRGHIVRNAFNYVWEKVHAQLRLEYVPRFLVSPNFATIKAKFDDAMGGDAGIDPVSECIKAMEEMDMRYIMENPLALDCFEEFLRENQVNSYDQGGVAMFGWAGLGAGSRMPAFWPFRCLVPSSPPPLEPHASCRFPLDSCPLAHIVWVHKAK